MMKANILCSFVLLIAFQCGPADGIGSPSARLILDEEIGEAIEIMFGESAQDDYAEFIHTCPGASLALKDAGNCLMGLNLTYERFSEIKHQGNNFRMIKSICNDILHAISHCSRPAIDAISYCANDRSFNETIETLYKAVQNGADKLCYVYNIKLEDFMKEGFPECFVRRSGRQMAKCFPGRTGYGGSADYLIYHVGHRFFDSKNCRLLRDQQDCAVNTLMHCQKEPKQDKGSSKDDLYFSKLMDAFYEDVCGRGNKNPGRDDNRRTPAWKHPAASTDGSSTITFSWLLFAVVLSQSLMKFW